MTATTAQATPAVPPRPSRNPDKDSSNGAASGPKIPPRPSRKRPERSLSPNADRFAPSPLNETILARAHSRTGLLSPNRGLFEPVEDPILRPGSVPMPSVGEEGMEYTAIAEFDNAEKERSRSTSPEQTRTVAEDLKLHAPKPSLPADSAKKRVMAVTRTDSDRAAAFGIGHPNAEDRAVSREGVHKRSSTTFSVSSDLQTDDEHGIPEIGQRVPMNPHLGDVQAPSPGPSESSSKSHIRKHSARILPPGSYGLHGHGVAPQDRLEREYYQKHPELLKKEEHTPLHDRQNDYALTSTELNRLVRDTASRGAGTGTAPEFRGTPTDEVAFQASDEYTRITSPRPGSAAQKDGHSRSTSLAKVASNTSTPSVIEPDEAAIHIDEPTHAEYRSYGDEPPAEDDQNHVYSAPILASDEVEKDANGYRQQPAVHPHPELSGSNHDSEDAPSRPTSGLLSLHKNSSQPEIRCTPLEDVEEYEPLFTEEAKKKEKKLAEAAEENKNHYHFPSKDIWEDAPSSVHYTATVLTPDLPEAEHHRSRSSGHQGERPITPAHAFAQHQEELAEREAKRRSGGNFLPLNESRPMWTSHQEHLKVEKRATGPRRFPSRDVWEDVPESQLYETTVTTPEGEERPEVPTRPTKKPSESSQRPSIPTRPKPRQGSGDDAKSKPPVSEKPKPQIPARKEKPPVPSRPAGGKIAALQAGFMSDLNQRLKIGPQVHKKEEPSEKEASEEKEKVPLSDARKGRARGPQRRAPAKSPAPPAEEPKSSGPVLSFSLPQSSWSIDPEEGRLSVDDEEPEQNSPKEEAPSQEEEPGVQAAEPESKPEPEVAEEPSKSEKAGDAEAPSETTEEIKTAEEPEKEEKTLVANMAGESVLEATVEKKDGGDKVDPVDVENEVKA